MEKNKKLTVLYFMVLDFCKLNKYNKKLKIGGM
jgi:hypothetical protein